MRPLYHFDNLDNQLGVVVCPLSVVRGFEINGDHTLEIESLTMFEKEDRVVYQDGLGEWREYIVVDATDDDSEGRVVHSASLTDSIEELAGDYIVEKEPTGVASNVLSVALEGSRWEVGTVNVTGSHRMSWYHTNALAAVRDICETFGAELSTTIVVSGSKVTRRLVNLRARLGSDKGKRFTYRKGLKSIKRTRGSNKVYTRLYGYGSGVPVTDESGNETGGFSRKITFGDVNKGIDYVETTDSALLKRWGRPDGKGGYAHSVGKVEFDDCEDKNELYQLTREYFENQLDPQMSYEADVIALKEAGFDSIGVEEGDTVAIIDEVFTPVLHLTGRVMAGKIDELKPENSSITLSNVQETFTDRMIREAEKSRSLYDHAASWDSAATLPGSYLDAVRKRLNEEFAAGGSYKHESFENGTIYSNVPLDENGKPTRTPAWGIQINQKGFRIASRVNSAGEFEWTTFGTGDGFTADVITAGVIRGGSNYWNLETGDLMFEQGGIRDSKGKNFWNLDTGEFALSASATIGGITLQDSLDELNDEIQEIVTDGIVTEAEAAAVAKMLQRIESEQADAIAAYTTVYGNSLLKGTTKTELYNAKYYLYGTSNTAGVYGTLVTRIKSVIACTTAADLEIAMGNYNTAYTNYQTRRNAFTSALQAAEKYINEVYAANAAADAVDAQTQLDIFNKLTDGGKTQGIFLTDGRVYINGTYIQIGTITSKGGSHWNLDTGEFETIYTISESLVGSYSTYKLYQETVLVVDMTLSTPFGIYRGYRYRYNYNDGTISYGSVSSKTFVAGITMDGQNAYLRAQRVGTSNTNYMTTGNTGSGNPGASFVNSGGNYLDVEALHAVDSSANATNGVGFACFDKPFLDASTYYNRVWMWPPTYTDTYMSQPPEQLFLRRNGNVYLQRNDSQGIFFNSNGVTIKFNDSYYITINYNGVQCRCGNKGFGWYNGSFAEGLSWDNN